MLTTNQVAARLGLTRARIVQLCRAGLIQGTAGGGTARLDVVSDGAEFSPSYVGGDMLPEDARLIAAAPDLLAALQNVMAMYDSLTKAAKHGADCPCYHCQAHAAISKATGA